MEWNMAIHDENEYLEVITGGIADRDSSLEMVKALIAEMSARQITKVLIDHSNLDGVGGRASEIYNRPRQIKEHGAIMKIRIAEVIKPEHMEHFKFFETVCVNQGFQMSMFRDREKALAWLLG